MRIDSLWRRSATLLFIGFAACRQLPFEDADVSGYYFADHGVCQEVLSVKADGTFVQVLFVPKRSDPVQHSGSWSTSEDRRYIILEGGAFVVRDGLGRVREGFETPVDGLVLWPVLHSVWGGVQIAYAEDRVYRRLP